MAPSSTDPSPVIVDRYLLRARGRRALALGPSTFLLDRAAEDLAERLAGVLRVFPCGLDLGTQTDALRRALAGGGKVGAIIAANASVQAQFVDAGVTRGFLETLGGLLGSRRCNRRRHRFPAPHCFEYIVLD